ncbi:hypothetical protein F2Q69_00034846 [Brassica cretica]|uniref:Uncharacterized protein n=1 Tax=Brassica cretica TaxID=69181 RepID=A0A8S9SSP9_BRACR|nr:hypothetical protein F2Q69_00034846 [Brassica cretica]
MSEGRVMGGSRLRSLSRGYPEELRSDLPSIPHTRSKRLNIFPKDIQKQISEAKRMGTLPDLSAMIAAQLGLTSGEGPSTMVPLADGVLPSGTRGVGKGKKRKRGGSGVERSAEETSDVPPSGEPQKKKKKTKKRSVGDGMKQSWPSYLSSLSRRFLEERSCRHFAPSLSLVRDYRQEDSRVEVRSSKHSSYSQQAAKNLSEGYSEVNF